MEKNIVMLILLCPISILSLKYEEQDINIGYLYPEEREAMVHQKELVEVLGEVAIQNDSLLKDNLLLREIDQGDFAEGEPSRMNRTICNCLGLDSAPDDECMRKPQTKGVFWLLSNSSYKSNYLENCQIDDFYCEMVTPFID